MVLDGPVHTNGKLMVIWNKWKINVVGVPVITNGQLMDSFKVSQYLSTSEYYNKIPVT